MELVEVKKDRTMELGPLKESLQRLISKKGKGEAEEWAKNMDRDQKRLLKKNGMLVKGKFILEEIYSA